MTEKPYSVQTKPLPLDMLSEGPGGDCWYRIPSWQIEFVSEVLAGLDLRIHRGLGNEGIWTLTEASTGCRLYDGWQDEPEDTAEDMLGEFIAVYLPKLTRDMMEKSIAGAKEKIKGRLPNPFARPEAVPSTPSYAEVGYLLKNEYGFVSAHVPNLVALPQGQTPVFLRFCRFPDCKCPQDSECAPR